MNPYNHFDGNMNGAMPTDQAHFQSVATDFLSPLSQMSDNLGSNSNLANNKPPTSSAMNHNDTINHHPGTPMGQHPGTPQQSHPPGTPQHPGMDNNQPLRHPTPAPGTPGSLQQPHTPQGNMPAPPTSNMSPVCHTNTVAGGTTNAATTPNNQNNNGTPQGDTNINNNQLTHNDIVSDLNFDPEAIIDGEGAGQEGLDVSGAFTSSVK